MKSKKLIGFKLKEINEHYGSSSVVERMKSFSRRLIHHVDNIRDYLRLNLILMKSGLIEEFSC